MTTLVIVGAQWGDEGKGKIVDRLAGTARHVVRYGGGANAGHTLVVDGEKVVLHLVPSGALRPEAQCLLGPGMVLDLAVLVDELEALRKRDLLSPPSRLAISERAHVVLAQHKLVDALRERGPGAIGTTKRGIGPCYEDRAGRVGVRIGDLRSPQKLREKIAISIERWRPTILARSPTRCCRTCRTSATGSTRRARLASPSCSRARRARCSTSTTAPTPS